MRKTILVGSGIGVAAVAAVAVTGMVFLMPASTEKLGGTTVAVDPDQTPKPAMQHSNEVTTTPVR